MIKSTYLLGCSSILFIGMLAACGAQMSQNSSGASNSGAASNDPFAPCTDADKCCAPENMICTGDVDRGSTCFCTTLWDCTKHPKKCEQNLPTPDGNAGWTCTWSDNDYRCQKAGTTDDKPNSGSQWNCSFDETNAAWVCTSDFPPNPTNNSGGTAGWDCLVNSEFNQLECERQDTPSSGAGEGSSGGNVPPSSTIPGGDSATGCNAPDEFGRQDCANGYSKKSFERGATPTGILIDVDTSVSMQPKQMASACAMDAFYQVTKGSSYTIGVTTMDVLPLYDSSGNIKNIAPHLVDLDGTCNITHPCQCNGTITESKDEYPVCKFNQSGQYHRSGAAGVESMLKQLIVQGANEQSDLDEGGLEKAFRIVLETIKKKKAMGASAVDCNNQTTGSATCSVSDITQVVAISDEKANGDEKLCKVQALRYSGANLSLLKTVLGNDFAPPANTGDCDKDLTNFYIAFFKRYGIQVNVLVDSKGKVASELDSVYMDVAKATGGAIGDIYTCADFTTFFTQVGLSTVVFNTQLCLGEAADLSTITVTHEAKGQVPKQDADGWSYDAALNCVLLKGSWASVDGKYEISYKPAN